MQRIEGFVLKRALVINVHNVYIIRVLCMLVLYSYVEKFMLLNGMILFELSRRWSKDITACHACMHAVMYNKQETLNN